MKYPVPRSGGSLNENESILPPDYKDVEGSKKSHSKGDSSCILYEKPRDDHQRDRNVHGEQAISFNRRVDLRIEEMWTVNKRRIINEECDLSSSDSHHTLLQIFSSDEEKKGGEVFEEDKKDDDGKETSSDKLSDANLLLAKLSRDTADNEYEMKTQISCSNY